MIVSTTGTNVPPIAAVTILGGRTQWEGVADSAGTQKRMECHRASIHCRKLHLSTFHLKNASEFSSCVMVYRDRILVVF
jgi:hypothetical protein